MRFLGLRVAECGQKGLCLPSQAGPKAQYAAHALACWEDLWRRLLHQALTARDVASKDAACDSHR